MVRSLADRTFQLRCSDLATTPTSSAGSPSRRRSMAGTCFGTSWMAAVLTFMAGPSRATATTWAVRMPRTRTAKGVVTCSRSSTSCDTKQSWEQRNSLSRCFLMKLGCCQLWVRMDFYRTFLLGLIWKTWSPPPKRSHYSSTQAYSSQSPARRDERGATSDR